MPSEDFDLNDLKPLTVDQVIKTPDALVKGYNDLVLAIKSGKISDPEAVQRMNAMDAEIKALKQEKALEQLGRPAIGSESLMRQFVVSDKRAPLRLRGGDVQVENTSIYVPGLLDSKPVCEWQRELQDLCELRTIAMIARGQDQNLGGSPKLDAMIRRHFDLAPAEIRKAAGVGDTNGMVQRLFSGAAGTGAEVAQTLVLPRIEEQLKVIAESAAYFEEVEMGSKTVNLPFMTTGLRPYLKGAPTGDNPAYYTSSTPDLTQRSFTASGMAVMVQLLDDADEDSIIAMAPFLRTQIAEALRDGEEDTIFNGDTAATHQDTIASWNARGRWGTVGLGTSLDHRRAHIGLRARCVDIGATAQLDGSSYTAVSGTAGLFSAAELKLQVGSMNGPLVYFVSPEHFIKVIKADSNLLTLEKYGPQATIYTGEVGKVGMIRIQRSQWLTADLNASGIFDNATTTKTNAVLCDARRFKRFRRRGLQFDVAREVRNGVTYMVATNRGTFGTVDSSTAVNAVHVYNLAKS